MILHGHYQICIVMRHLEPNSILILKELSKARTGSSMGHFQWFLPMHVIVDIFHVTQILQQTSTMVVVTGGDEELFLRLMDLGRDSKIHCGKDIINCVVAKHNVKLR